MRERKPPTVTRSTCERYDIRLDGLGWAIITIDERSGLFSAVSDFGNYGYTWPCHGRQTFKHFLVEIDTDYLKNKLGHRDYFLHDATEKAWRKEVLESRRRGEIDKATAWGAWDAINHMEFASAEQAYHDLCDSEDLGKVFTDPCCITLEKDFSPDLRMFVERIWPAFTAALRKELPRLQEVAS